MNNVSAVIEKLKELVRKGNVSRIQVSRNGKIVVNIPVSVGVVGAVVGLTSAKWVLLGTVLATIGFGCSVEIVKLDGEVVSVVNEEDSVRMRDAATTVANNIVEEVKDVIDPDKHE